MTTTRCAALMLCFLLLPLQAHGQATVADLAPDHASALQKFIEGRPSLEFLSEKVMDAESLKDIRKHHGARLTPYYRVGDFNRDGVRDFAMILAKEGPPIGQEGVTSEAHMYRHPISIVIFNGQRRGGYRVAFEKNTDAPLVCFLYLTFEKRRRLSFGVYETDEGFIMTPAGRGYLIEYDDY